MTLGNRIAAKDELRTALHDALGDLQKVAARLEMSAVGTELADVDHGLQEDRFRLVVAGRFNIGKSTLLNALLTDTTHPVDLGGAAGPLPADKYPCTAVLTRMRYSAVPYVRVRHTDGTVLSWSLDQYLRESTLDGELSNDDNRARFTRIEEFELGYPARLLQSVELCDTPGLDEDDSRTRITRDECAASDAAILVFSSKKQMGAQELADGEEVRAGKGGTFTVVNMWRSDTADPPFRARLWKSYVQPQLPDPAAHPWDHQDLEQDYRIHFVDALRALRSRQSGDEAGVAAHGLAAFEEQLATFLVEERAAAHVTSHAHRALAAAARMEAAVAERRRVHTTARAEFDEWARRMAIALRETENRGGALGRIITRNAEAVRGELDRSFALSELNLRRSLEQHLLEADVPALGDLTAGWFPNRVAEEMAGVARQYVADRREEWLRDEAAAIVAANRAALAAELERELDLALRPVVDAHLDLSGDTDLRERVQVVSTVQQWTAGALAVLTLNGAAAMGAGGGFRAVGGGIAGMALTGVLLGVAGITAAPVVIPAAIVGAAIGGSQAGRIGLRKRVVEASVPAYTRDLEDGEARRRHDLGAQVEARYADLRAGVERDFALIVEREREEHEQLRAARRHEGAQLTQWLADLTAAGDELAVHAATVERVVARAEAQAAAVKNAGPGA